MADRDRDERSYRGSYYGGTYDCNDDYGRSADRDSGFGRRSNYGRSSRDYDYGSQGHGSGYGRSNRDYDYSSRGYGSGYGRDYGSAAQGRSRGEDHDYEYWSGRYGNSRGRDYDYGSQGRSGDFERDFDYGSRDYGSRYDRYSDSSHGNSGGRVGKDYGNRGRDFDEPISWTYTEIWWTPGPQTGQGPRGYQRSDERVQEDVNERITQHGQLDASNIEVKVEDCEVTLTGTVNTRQEKRMAEDTAESVWGVKDVHNQLRVKREQSDQQNQQNQQNQQKQPTPERAGQTT